MSGFLICEDTEKGMNVLFTNDSQLLQDSLAGHPFSVPGEGVEARKWAMDARPGDRLQWSKGVIISVTGNVTLTTSLKQNAPPTPRRGHSETDQEIPPTPQQGHTESDQEILTKFQGMKETWLPVDIAFYGHVFKCREYKLTDFANSTKSAILFFDSGNCLEVGEVVREGGELHVYGDLDDLPKNSVTLLLEEDIRAFVMDWHKA